MPDDADYRNKRETMLVVLGSAVAIMSLVVVFTFLTGGFLTYILGGVAAVAALGGINYLLWGRAMTQNTAGDREEMELREQSERSQRDWSPDDPRSSRHE